MAQHGRTMAQHGRTVLARSHLVAGLEALSALLPTRSSLQGTVFVADVSGCGLGRSQSCVDRAHLQDVIDCCSHLTM